jgi:hypothetical protein
MPACARFRASGARLRRVFFYIVFVGLCGTTALALASSFKVSSVQARVVGPALSLRATLELGLTPAVEEAIANGIPIELAIDVRLYRERPFLWDEKVGNWTLRRELRYYALTGQYLISAEVGAPVTRESFVSLNEALTQLGLLEEFALALRAPLAPDMEYRLELRAGLNVEALPALLRPVAYTSRAWDLNSGWTTWRVQR